MDHDPRAHAALVGPLPGGGPDLSPDVRARRADRGQPAVERLVREPRPRHHGPLRGGPPSTRDPAVHLRARWGRPGPATCVQRHRGQVLMAQGRLDEAGQELSAALEVAIEVGNPPQLWKTHAAVGDLRRTQERTGDAGRSYGEALSVIEGVAESLTDEKLRKTF